MTRQSMPIASLSVWNRLGSALFITLLAAQAPAIEPLDEVEMEMQRIEAFAPTAAGPTEAQSEVRSENYLRTSRLQQQRLGADDIRDTDNDPGQQSARSLLDLENVEQNLTVENVGNRFIQLVNDPAAFVNTTDFVEGSGRTIVEGAFSDAQIQATPRQ